MLRNLLCGLSAVLLLGPAPNVLGQRVPGAASAERDKPSGLDAAVRDLAFPRGPRMMYLWTGR